MVKINLLATTTSITYHYTIPMYITQDRVISLLDYLQDNMKIEAPTLFSVELKDMVGGGTILAITFDTDQLLGCLTKTNHEYCSPMGLLKIWIEDWLDSFSIHHDINVPDPKTMDPSDLAAIVRTIS